MTLTIISSQYSGLFKALESLGAKSFADIKWHRFPMRTGSTWRCDVSI